MNDKNSKKAPSFGKKPKQGDTYANLLNGLKARARNGVIKDSEGKVKGTLDPMETTRYEAIFKVFKNVVFPPKEVGEVERTPPIPKVPKMPIVSTMVSNYDNKGKDKKSGGNPLSMLSGLGLMKLIPLALGIGVAISALIDSVGGVAKDIKDGMASAIKFLKAFNAIETIGKFLKPLKAFFKPLKAIFKSVGGVLKSVGKSLMPLGKGALDFIKNFGGKTIDGVIDAFKTMKSVGKSITSFFGNFGGKIGGVAKSALEVVKVLGGKALGGLMGAFDTLKGVGSTIASFFGSPMDKVGKVGSALGGVAKGGGGLMKMFGKVSSKLGKALKFIPFVGSIFSFMSAYSAFKEGRYGRGILELLSGILNFVPIVGNIASGLLDGGMLLYDLLDSSEEGEGSGGGVMSKLGDLTSKGGQFFKEMGTKILDKLKGIFGGLGSWIGDMAMGMVNKAKEFFGFGGETKLEKELRLETKRVQALGEKDAQAKAKDLSIKEIKDYNPIAFKEAQDKGAIEFNQYLDDTREEMANPRPKIKELASVGGSNDLVAKMESINSQEAIGSYQHRRIGFGNANIGNVIEDPITKDLVTTKDVVSKDTNVDAKTNAQVQAQGNIFKGIKIDSTSQPILDDIKRVEMESLSQRNTMIAILEKIDSKLGDRRIVFSNDHPLREFMETWA